MAEDRSIRRYWNRVSVVEVAEESPAPDVVAREASPLSGGTFIGSGAVFEGTLTLAGDFEIDTEFRGQLETDGTIVVGLQGSVVGSIRAREVAIRGAVVGNVSAPRQLILESTGERLHGDIETACLEIQKHAVFRGTTSMTQPQAVQRLAAAAPGAVVAPGPSL